MNPLSTGIGAVGKQYTYGVDEKGMMYIYDRSAGKMAFYGHPSQGQAMVGSIQLGGGRLTNEGNRSNTSGGGNRNQRSGGVDASPDAPPTDAAVYSGGGGGGGYSAPAKVLDEAQIRSIQGQMGGYDAARDTNKQRSRLKRDASLNEKRQEREREEGKYKGKKLSTLQEFGGAKTDTDINVRDTLENLVSSLSTMGLGGGRALSRQILAAANQSNRKANATQAQNNQGLDSAWNEFEEGNKSDMEKVQDQHDFEVAEAEREWARNRQNSFYKIADVYGAADKTAEREQQMQEGNNLNSVINNSSFLNPRYDGKARAMATPELSDYTQDIAQYDTTGVGAGAEGGLVPAGGAPAAGNMAIKAIAVNDRDLGLKKKTEGNLGYGV